ncbi:hypothetical protein [Shewanella sp.]|uniref:hypothetical protein n=1 Tax=Shewanella sp. TaxID=50422 RepID=UPI003A97AB89
MTNTPIAGKYLIENFSCSSYLTEFKQGYISDDQQLNIYPSTQARLQHADQQLLIGQLQLPSQAVGLCYLAWQDSSIYAVSEQLQQPIVLATDINALIEQLGAPSVTHPFHRLALQYRLWADDVMQADEELCWQQQAEVMTQIIQLLASKDATPQSALRAVVIDFLVQNCGCSDDLELLEQHTPEYLTEAELQHICQHSALQRWW